MMIGSIILIVLGVMALIGIGSTAIRDFGVPTIALVLVFGAIVGLNFIPQTNINNAFYFSFGTALLVVMTFFLWLLKGSIKNRALCLLISIVLAGVLYGATRLANYFNSDLWSRVNVYYALMIGFFAFIVTRNAKYAFIASVLSVTVATLLTQIGSPINLDEVYTPSIIASGVAVVLYSMVSALMPSRPSKMTYYYEMGRLED